MNRTERTDLRFALGFLVVLLVLLASLAGCPTDTGERLDDAAPAHVVTTSHRYDAITTTSSTTTTAPPTTTTTSTTAPPRTTSTTEARLHAASAAAPEVAPASGDVADMIRAGFSRFGSDVAEQAVRVSWCESRHNPSARNGVHVGLFQLSRTYHEERAARLGYSWDRMSEAGPNIAVAADLYADSGWQPWTCRTAA